MRKGYLPAFRDDAIAEGYTVDAESVEKHFEPEGSKPRLCAPGCVAVYAVCSAHLRADSL